MNEIIGKIEFLNNGNAYLKREDEKEIFIFKKNTLNSLHLDTVKVRGFKRLGKFEGEVIEVLERYKTSFVGTTHVNNGLTFVYLDNSKYMVDFFIPKESTMNVKNNQKVLIEFNKWKIGSKSPYAKIVKILGDKGSNNAEMNSIMHEYNLPTDFPLTVLEESNGISTEITNDEISKRLDLRNILTFTIDGETAKDFDDALSVKYIDDYLEIGIHIADITHYITPDMTTYQEAYNRSTSIYLVDRCIPMLPEKLSNNLCSLVPNTDKLTYSLIIKINKNGNVFDKWIGRTVIHSDYRFTYEQVQEIIENNDSTTEVNKSLLDLDRLAKILRTKRTDSVDINQVEVNFKLDENSKPVSVYFKYQKDSNKLIEEFMLLANREVGNFIKEAGLNTSWRIHETPSEEKLLNISNVVSNFGYEPIDIESNIRKQLNNILFESIGTPEENMLKSLITKSMKKAKYDTNPIGHFGLGDLFNNYCHFTSPIRRMADVISHEILTSIITNNKIIDNDLQSMCEHISKMEVISAKAQRDSIKYKQTEFLLDKIGYCYDGLISGITDWGVYVEIIENKCEGLIKSNDIIPGIKFYMDTDNFIAIGDDGTKLRLGDLVSVRITGVNLDKKTIDMLFN